MTEIEPCRKPVAMMYTNKASLIISYRWQGSARCSYTEGNRIRCAVFAPQTGPSMESGVENVIHCFHARDSDANHFDRPNAGNIGSPDQCIVCIVRIWQARLGVLDIRPGEGEGGLLHLSVQARLHVV